MYSACCLSFVKYILYFILFNSEKFALKQLYVIMHCTVHAVYLLSYTLLLQGRIQDFKLGGGGGGGGGALKKNAPSGWRR